MKQEYEKPWVRRERQGGIDVFVGNGPPLASQQQSSVLTASLGDSEEKPRAVRQVAPNTDFVQKIDVVLHLVSVTPTPVRKSQKTKCCGCS